MSKESLKKIHLIYGIVLSVLLAVLSVLLIVACISIYKIGPSPFTRQSVWEHFAKIAVFVYLTIAVIIGGGILSTICPLEKERLKGSLKDGIVLRRLYKKLESISDEASAKIEKQRIIRFAMIIVSMVLIVGATVSSLVKVLSAYDATAAINSEVLNGWLTVTYYFFVPTAYLIVTAYICKRSVKKELEVVKNELKNAKTAGDVSKKEEDTASLQADTVSEGCQEQDEKNIGPVTKLTNELGETVEQIKAPKKWHKIAYYSIFGVLACTAITFIVVGLANNGTAEVVKKAIAICKECIGMG